MTSLRSSFPALPRAVLHRSVVKSVTLRTKKAEDMFSAFTMDFGLRKERDSNPRNLSVQRFSRPPQSTALPSFRRQKYHLISILPNSGRDFAPRPSGVRRSAHGLPERPCAAAVPTGCLPVVRVPAVRRPCGRGLPLPAGKKVETDVREIFINFVGYG